MQLDITGIEYRYPQAAEPVLRGVTATFPRGWTGIVGDNGCGKTTLARIACGLLEPDTGSVSRGLVAAYCPQDATELPPGLEDFACAFDRAALRLRSALGIEEGWAWRYDTLSGGQQKRLQVAAALWRSPDLLVADEPTNHVDASTRAALQEALVGFRGIGLLISHDRVLLDSLCTRCLFVSGGRATMRPGSYSQASGQTELERESALRKREEMRRERRRIEREVQRRREEAARAASRRSARNVAKHDSDAREKIRLAIVSGQDGAAGRLASRMEARLEGATARLEASAVEKRYAADLWMDAKPSRRQVLVRRKEGTLSLGEAMLELPALHIGNRDHIGLMGDNGSGKTTLVRALVEELPEDVPCLYIPQEPAPCQKDEATARLAALGRGERGWALSIVAQLNSRPERLLEGGDLSPGELRKLMLALGMLDGPQLIVMDEPTNHLDLASTQALERLLAGYPGALLLVSHDWALMEAVTDVTWRIGRVGDARFYLSVGA